MNSANAICKPFFLQRLELRSGHLHTQNIFKFDTCERLRPAIRFFLVALLSSSALFDCHYNHNSHMRSVFFSLRLRSFALESTSTVAFARSSAAAAVASAAAAAPNDIRGRCVSKTHRSESMNSLLTSLARNHCTPPAWCAHGRARAQINK